MRNYEEVEVETIEPMRDSCGEHHKATLKIKDHHCCIEVIGATLTECVERTNVIVQAFRKYYNPEV